MNIRWAVQEGTLHAKPRLQVWVQNPCAMKCPGLDYSEDGEWVDVPTVAVPAKPGEPPACCGGGPQWGHAWTCQNAAG